MSSSPVHHGVTWLIPPRKTLLWGDPPASNRVSPTGKTASRRTKYRIATTASSGPARFGECFAYRQHRTSLQSSILMPALSNPRTIAITSIEKARQLELSAHHSRYSKPSRAAEKGPPRIHDAEVCCTADSSPKLTILCIC